ncbi:MAG: rhomboid family intramembrane serine protease [Bacteroidales bacterium]
MNDNIFSEYSRKLKNAYKQGDIFIKMIFFIAVSHVVFLALDFILYKMFNVRASEYLLLSGDYRRTLARPWTIISYILINKELVAMIMTCISLWAMSKLNAHAINDNQAINLIFYGTVLGAIFYTLGFTYRYSGEDAQVYKLMMYGFTPAIFALLSALAMQSKKRYFAFPMFGRVNMSVFLFIIIGAFFASNNAENSLIMYANAGGIVAGILIAMMDAKAIAPYINFTKIGYMLSAKHQKPKTKKTKKDKKASEMSDHEYNKRKADKQKRMDAILDKIKEKGYEGLTPDEKRELFEK